MTDKTISYDDVRPLPHIGEIEAQEMLKSLTPCKLDGGNVYREYTVDDIDHMTDELSWRDASGPRVYFPTLDQADILMFSQCGAPSVYRGRLIDALASIKLFLPTWHKATHFAIRHENLTSANCCFGGMWHWAPLIVGNAQRLQND